MKYNRDVTTILQGTILRRRSSFCAAIALAASLIGAASTCSAAVIFSDDFSAPDGPLAGTTPDVGSTNWTPTAAAATPIQIASGAAAVKSSGQDEYAGLSFVVPANLPGFVNTSLDVNVSAAQANGDYFAHLSSPLATTTSFFQRLFAKSTAGGYLLGLVDTSGTGSTITYGTTALALNTTYDVDITWTFLPGLNNDAFVLTVNSLPYLTHAWTSATPEPTTLAAANLRQGSASNAPTLTVDNLVVSYIPEPSTLLLGGVFGLMALAFRKSRSLL